MTDTEKEEVEEKRVTIDIAYIALSSAAKMRYEIRYLTEALYNLDDEKKKNRFSGHFTHSLRKKPHELTFISSMIDFTPTPEIIKLVIREKGCRLTNFNNVINTYIEHEKQYEDIEKEDALVNLYEYGLVLMGFLKERCYVDFKPVDMIIFECSSRVLEAFKLEGKLDDLSKIGWSITEILPTNINCSISMNESDHKSEKLAKLFQMVYNMTLENVLDEPTIKPMAYAFVEMTEKMRLQNEKEARGEL